ncbi:unnamed protein product, partial [Nesidiocoris tenuis]
MIKKEKFGYPVVHQVLPRCTIIRHQTVQLHPRFSKLEQLNSYTINIFQTFSLRSIECYPLPSWSVPANLSRTITVFCGIMHVLHRGSCTGQERISDYEKARILEPLFFQNPKIELLAWLKKSLNSRVPFPVISHRCFRCSPSPMTFYLMTPGTKLNEESRNAYADTKQNKNLAITLRTVCPMDSENR